MATVYIRIDTRNNKNNLYPIRFFLSHRQKQTTISTKYAVSKNNWDKFKYIKKPTDNIPSPALVNHKLRNKLNDIIEYIEKLEETGRIGSMTVYDIRNGYQEQYKLKSEHGFYHYFLKQIELKRTEGTKEIYKRTYYMLKEKYPNLTFHDITTTFLTELEINLRDEMRVNTIGINMRNIRSLFNAAIDDNNLPDISLQDYPFRKYKIPSEKTAKRNIDIETIKQIRDTDLTGIPELARDIFMLIFYLIGINIKDLSYLTHNNTINNRITYTRHKGGRFYSIKIEPEAAEIIEKIKGDNYLIKLLDHYKNYTTVKKEINKKLKKVTEKIGMEELKLTTYYARHSWATIARQAGISIDDIGLSLGHSDNETTITRTYIEENTETIDRANRTVLNLLKEPEHDKPAQAPEL